MSEKDVQRCIIEIVDRVLIKQLIGSVIELVS